MSPPTCHFSCGDVTTKTGSLDGLVVRVGGSRTLQNIQKRGQWARFDNSRLPLSPSPAPKQVENTRATCRGVCDKTIQSPAVHKRMPGEYLLDVFGVCGFFGKRGKSFGFRGYVLDTKFDLWYDVTQPPFLTRIRQDVSSGKCVAGMLSPPRLHTSCSSNVISAIPAIANLLHRARLGFWNTRLIRGCGTCRKSRLLRHSLARHGHWRIFVSLDLHTDSERCFWLKMWIAGICTVLLANVQGLEDAVVFQHKNMFIPKLLRHDQRFHLHVTTPALPVYLSRLP